MDSKCASAVILVFCLVSLGCRQQSAKTNATGTSSPAERFKTDTTETSSPAGRVKIDLQLEADPRLTVPDGVFAKVAHGAWDPMVSIYDPPVHPLGTIEHLTLYGSDVPLASREIKNGMLATRDFGEVEVFLAGTGHYGLHLIFCAYPADIERLRKAYPVPIGEWVEEYNIDRQKLLAADGGKVGSDHFAMFACPSCHKPYLLECETDVLFLDGRDLKKQAPFRSSNFTCVACGKMISNDGAWIGPRAKAAFRVRYRDIEQSDWAWILNRES